VCRGSPFKSKNGYFYDREFFCNFSLFPPNFIAYPFNQPCLAQCLKIALRNIPLRSLCSMRFLLTKKLFLGMEKPDRGLFSRKLILTFLKRLQSFWKGGDTVRNLQSFFISLVWKSHFFNYPKEGGIADESEKERRSSRNL
jgi:hypothetical protein